MKMFTKIWVVLTVLIVTEVAAMPPIAAWLMKMHYSNPAREQLLNSRISPVADICWYITFFPWLILTPIYLILALIHLSAWFFGKPTDGDKHEHQKPVA